MANEFIARKGLIVSGSTTVTSNVSANGNITAGTNLVSSYSSGDEGGELLLAKPQTNSTIAGTGVTIDIYQNKLRIFEQGGTARGGYYDITALAAGVATNLAGGSGTVTSLVAGNGLTGGTITTTGTITVDTGSAHFITGSTKVLDLKGIISSSTQQVVSAYTNATDNRVLTSTGTGGINAESTLTYDGTVLAISTNNAKFFQGGDDAALYDVNVANTLGIHGQQDSTVGAIKLGSAGQTIYSNATGVGIATTSPGATLHVQGNVSASSFTGSFAGTATTASVLQTTRTLWGKTFNGSANVSGTLTVDFTNGETNYLAIQRIADAGQEVRHSVDDTLYRIKYTNDESNSQLYLNFINTDTETGGGVSASNHAVIFNATYPGVSLSLPGTSTVTATTFSGTATGLSGGTTNYIPLWSSTTAQSSSNIYQSSENIGISTTSPQARLHSYSTTNNLILGIFEQAASSPSTTTPVVRIIRPNNTNGAATTSSAALYITDHSSNVALQVSTHTSASLLTVSGSGNVGIGTNTPNNRLQINVSGSSLPLALTTIDVSNRSGILFASSSIASGRSHWLFHRTNTPLVEWILNTNSGEYASWAYQPFDNSDYSLVFEVPRDGGITRIRGNLNQSLSFGANNVNNVLYITGSGNVGIGTTSPSAKLHVQGNVSASSFTGSFLATNGIVSSSTASSPSQGTVRVTINGANTDVDTGLQTGDSPSFVTLTSTQATGTAPFTVASRTVVSNLNADLLDGLDSTAFATTSSNTLTGIQTISNTTDSTTTNNGALIVAGGVGIAKNVNISGSVNIAGVLTVASMSTQYVTSSQLNVSDNKITVQTNDLTRFGGLSIFDSGSSNATASIYWDSLNHQFIYENISGAPYNSAVIIAGPVNRSTLGNEVGLTTNRVPVASGGDHIDSRVESSSIRVDFPSKFTHVEAGLHVTGSITASVAMLINGNTVWHAGNDGASSGLDADLLDGNHASAFYLASNPSGYTTNTGTVTSVAITAGTGLSGGGTVTTSGTITLNTDLSELTTSTTNTHGDFFVVVDSADSAQYKLTKANIALSGFNNDSGWTSNTGTVTSVGGTGTVSGLTLSGTVTTTGNLTLGGTLSVAASNFSSQTANTFLAAPNGSAGTPTFRAIVAADIPTLNQNTTGTASNITAYTINQNLGTGNSPTFVGLTTSGQTILGGQIYVSATNANTLNSGFSNNATADIWINYRGYNDGFTHFRNTNIGDGKGSNIAWFDGTNRRMSINNGQTANYTLDVNGTANVNGAFTAITKSFKIDHQRLPGKSLVYGVLEGPEHAVYVRGRLINNNVIQLPEEWEWLVDETSITVQLMPIGTHQQLYVETIENNQVLISGDVIDCFYLIHATRKDVELLDTVQ